tara:strand:- start:1070 stop:1888 length:819 start_codon:yes stop_codon:yes gene_type:complete
MRVTLCEDAWSLRPFERQQFARERCQSYRAEGSDLRRLCKEKRDGRISTEALLAGMFRSAATQALDDYAARGGTARMSHDSSLAAEISLLPPGCVLPTAQNARDRGIVVILDIASGYCIFQVSDVGPVRVPLSRLRRADAELWSAVDVVMRCRRATDTRLAPGRVVDVSPMSVGSHEAALSVFEDAKQRLRAVLPALLGPAPPRDSEMLAAAVRPLPLGDAAASPGFAPLALVALAYACCAMEHCLPALYHPPERPTSRQSTLYRRPQPGYW